MASETKASSSLSERVNQLGATNIVSYESFDPQQPDKQYSTVFLRISLPTSKQIEHFSKLGPYVLVSYVDTHQLKLFEVDETTDGFQATALCTYSRHQAKFSVAIVVEDHIISSDESGQVHEWPVYNQGLVAGGCLSRARLKDVTDSLPRLAHQHNVIAMDVATSPGSRPMKYVTASQQGEIKCWTLGLEQATRVINMNQAICDLRITVDQNMMVLTKDEHDFKLNLTKIDPQGERVTKQFVYNAGIFFGQRADQLRIVSNSRIVGLNAKPLQIGLIKSDGEATLTEAIQPVQHGRIGQLRAFSRDLFFSHIHQQGDTTTLTVQCDSAEQEALRF